jgi:hypothetical protein
MDLVRKNLGDPLDNIPIAKGPSGLNFDPNYSNPGDPLGCIFHPLENIVIVFVGSLCSGLWAQIIMQTIWTISF